MHQTKKGNEWRFGMKRHIGVDAGSGLVHTITVTAANKHDITETAKLLREDDEVVYGDSGYLGIQKRPEIRQNTHFSNIDFRINRRPKSLSVGTNYLTIQYIYIIAILKYQGKMGKYFQTMMLPASACTRD